MAGPSHLTILALRHSTKHPIQSFLLILGIALGVGMMVAIDLANSSASQAFALSTDSIAGRATHQILATPNNIPSTLYETLRVGLGLRQIAPVVTGRVLLEEADELPLQLLGVDPFAEAPFRNYLGNATGGLSLEALTVLLVEPNTILLSEELGQRYNLHPGDSLTLVAAGERHIVTLVGLLQPDSNLSRRALAGLILTDISTAQELLAMTGQLSHIDLILDPKTNLDPILARLPNGVQLQRASLRNETLDQLTDAFELNLTALSLLGLVVGVFLIYNTISFSVVQRRPILGTLRCLGVTRREIFGLVLGEALILSMVGSLVGLGLGMLLGRGLVTLVTQSINDLYFNLTVRKVALQPWTLYKGVTAGLASGLFAAAIPALEATTIPPSSTLKRSTAEARAQQVIPWISLAGGLSILGGGALLLIRTRSVAISFTALFFIVIGVALLTPMLTRWLVAPLPSLTGRLAGIVGLLAPRDIVRSLSRTSVTIAALMVAVSVIIGVSIMVASFRNTVIDWLDTVLMADIFISPTNLADRVSPEFIAAMQDRPEIERIELMRQATVLSPDYGPLQINAFSNNTTETRRRFLWTDGGVSQALEALDGGAILVTEAFARQYGLPLNRSSEIRLTTAAGVRSFPVAGVFYNYSPQGFILMRLETYRALWRDPIITGVALYLPPKQNVDRMVEALRTDYAVPYSLNVSSNRGLKQSAIVVFDRTFTITAALRLLATVVAFIGVLSALMSLQLERTRELGTLRANGMTTGQLWGMTLLESGVMGFVAGLIAIPAGLVMAAVLIYVINVRSFGWSLQLQLSPQILLMAMVVSLTAALMASIYPALRLGKMEIAAALRDE